MPAPAKAALKVACDLVDEGVISQTEAILRVEPASLDQLLHPTIDPDAPRDVVAAGLPASPGAATGRIVFDADEAERLGQAGESVILVREETSPEDIHGMHAAKGILTARGEVTGVVAIANGHFSRQHRGDTTVVGVDQLWVDVGASTKAQASPAGPAPITATS